MIRNLGTILVVPTDEKILLSWAIGKRQSVAAQTRQADNKGKSYDHTRNLAEHDRSLILPRSGVHKK